MFGGVRMDSSTFLAEFKHIANAPNGVKKLREMILDLAVRGKLVSQDSDDEPASVLLEELFITNKKCNPVDNSDCLWEIPESWTWCRFGNIINFSMGKTPPRKKSVFWADSLKEGHHWVSIGDMPSKGSLDRTKEFISFKAKEEVFKREPSPAGSLLMSFKLSIGKVVLLKIAAFHNEAIITINTTKENLKMFLFQVLPLISNLGNKNSAVKGSTLNSSSISNLLLPLPPLEEQKRIVAKVDELMALCDKLEQAQQAREKTRSALCTSALSQLMSAESGTDLQMAWSVVSEHFATLANHPSAVKELRDTILQLAVRGKLVPQDPNDEPAEKLLEKIKAEKERLVEEKKIKKQKPLPPITNEDKPFEVPKGWVWDKFDNLMLVGNGITKGKKYENREMITLPYLRVANVKAGYLKLDQVKEIEIPKDEINKYSVQIGDVLLTEGGDWDKLGRSAIWNGEITPCLHQNHVFRATPIIDDLKSLWISLYTNSLDGRHYFQSCSKQTTNLASINKTQLRNCPLPIPPRQEVDRIIKKYNELMALCDRLEAHLTNRHKTANLLAQSATKTVVEDLAMLEGKSKEVVEEEDKLVLQSEGSVEGSEGEQLVLF